MKTKITCRNILAHILLAWMSVIMISAVVFMHKEVKSNGEIVMHNHPYDFTSDQPRPQETDEQIDFFNVVYHQNVVQTDFLLFEEPIFYTTTFSYSSELKPLFENQVVDHAFLRGPPQFA